MDRVAALCFVDTGFFGFVIVRFAQGWPQAVTQHRANVKVLTLMWQREKRFSEHKPLELADVSLGDVAGHGAPGDIERPTPKGLEVRSSSSRHRAGVMTRWMHTVMSAVVAFCAAASAVTGELLFWDVRCRQCVAASCN